MIEMNPRRYKIMEVAPDVIANLASGTFRVTAGKLPEGTRIVSRCYDSRRDTFQLILEHESFEPVVPGGEIPFAEGVFIKLIDAPAQESREPAGSRPGHRCPTVGRLTV